MQNTKRQKSGTKQQEKRKRNLKMFILKTIESNIMWSSYLETWNEQQHQQQQKIDLAYHAKHL